MAEREIVLINETGLHARPASMIVREVSRYDCDIKFIKDNKEYNPKSLMSLLSMGAVKGDSVLIKAIGNDAENTVEDLADFIVNNIRD